MFRYLSKLLSLQLPSQAEKMQLDAHQLLECLLFLIAFGMICAWYRAMKEVRQLHIELLVTQNELHRLLGDKHARDDFCEY